MSLTPTWVMLGVLWAAGTSGAARLPAVRQGREYGRRACPVQVWKVWLLRTVKVGEVHVSHFWPEDSNSYSSSSALAPDERKKDNLQRQQQAEHYISTVCESCQKVPSALTVQATVIQRKLAIRKFPS